jgi:hypothetical protein
VKTIIEYRYSYFTIYRFWGDAGARWRWEMTDQGQLADATVFKGELRLRDAFDKSLVGGAFRGFVEFRRTSPHLSRFGEFQSCTNDRPIEWFCLHGTEVELETEFLPLDGAATLPRQTSFVALDGDVRARAPGFEVTAGAMSHLQPRDFPIELSGRANAFLIRKSRVPLQPSSGPRGMPTR